MRVYPCPPTPPPPLQTRRCLTFAFENALRLARFSKTAHLEALILAYLKPHVYLTCILRFTTVIQKAVRVKKLLDIAVTDISKYCCIQREREDSLLFNYNNKYN